MILLTAACHKCDAQEEHWDTYLTTHNGKPASIMLDMSLINTAPDKKYPILVVTGPQAKRCDEKGLPARDEINTLEEILAATSSYMNGISAKKLAGTMTCNCQRLNYYYVKDTFGLRNALARMYGRSYSDYRYMVSVTNDPQWKIYRTFLYPNDTTLNWMENNRTIAEIVLKGDSLKTERPIDFDVTFADEAHRTAFSKEAEANGYAVKATTQTTKHFAAYAIVLEKASDLLPENINNLTLALKALARRHEGVLEGWHTARP